MERPAVKFLQSMLEHGPVFLLEHVSSHLDDIVRPNTNHVRIERRVMKLAERQAVRHYWEALRMSVRQDVRRFEEFYVPKSADRAVFPVRE
jgi:hypothetical protein